MIISLCFIPHNTYNVYYRRALIMDTRKYYEDELSKILNKYQGENLSIITFYQTKIMELVMQIENEHNLLEIYNLANALVTK